MAEQPQVTAAAALNLTPGQSLDEAEAKALLSRHGIRSPREGVAANAQEAAALAEKIGFPVAVKIVSPDILHKTEYGGVALGLSTADAVEAAVAHMAATIPDMVPDARISGYLVSEMVSGGIECIVGVHHDEAFGPVITFGLGGTLVELFNDTVCALAPVSVDEARAMMQRTKTYSLLNGYRGGVQYDVDALAAAIAAMSMLAASHANEIATIEINPLMALPIGQGVVALDAVIETVGK